ncbi:MAG TPA: ATPase, T2SS/T4P/T4SS family [Candidatus Polarisedimenticolaceae bacterium]|nr:ATPase, T2SS/T4P/T4SS family [Candidatus Polarisedimenticolaceae bacterium]
MLSAKTQQNLEELLLEKNILDSKQLDDFKLRSIQENKPLLTIIQEAGMVDEEQMTRLFASASGLQYVNLSGVVVPQDILSQIPRDLAATYKAVAFGKVDGRLAVAMVDPSNIQAIDFLSRKTGQQIAAYMTSQEGIETIMLQYAAEMSADIKDVIEKAKEDDTEKASAKNVQNLVQDAPITKALNTILEYAVNSRASDIHIEPREKDVRIRFRIDGVLQETMQLPKTIEPALVSRIKIQSNLKIDEHRIPQDGQFMVRVGKKEVDLRIAIAPIVHGEQIVIRLLDKDNTLLTLESLGFKGRAYRLILEGIHQSHGMTLSTGPTGSGKSTTLYAILQAVKNVAINIVTLEDPVEYKMEGVNQIQVNGDVGLTFASGLRSILRQDPNVIMVGEIRDQETASLAVQSALTGHVVLSTIHTNSAAGVLPRLLDMGVEPFLVGSTVNTVIGQRLCRRVCDICREGYEANDAEGAAIVKTLGKVMPKNKSGLGKAQEDLGYENIPIAGQSSFELFRGKGCKDCNKGYKGRIGIYEVFAMNEEVEKLLVGKATTSEIQNQAQEDGMISMKQDGYFKALNGLTTLEEVERVASEF